jgi:5-formyltetrahydrofolate cyclo-ligase
MQDKNIIRKNFLARRMSLAPELVATRSAAMCSLLRNWLPTRSYTGIFVFQPFRNEPDLTPLIGQPGAVFYVPVVVSSSQMLFYAVDEETQYQAGKWGIPEPVVSAESTPVRPDSSSLIIMPALAADRAGHRLGYGGGFYDRFLEQHQSTLMVALFDDFIVEKIPVETHDVRVNYLLTESGIVPVA